MILTKLGQLNCSTSPETHTHTHTHIYISLDLNVFYFFFADADLIPKLTEHHFYYKPKCFPHFMYISKLIRNLTLEVEKIINIGLPETTLRTDVIIKITYLGEITEDNLRLVTKKKGNTLKFLKNKYLT